MQRRKQRKKKAAALVPSERIERAILLIRGRKVILDADLADLYGVATKRLNEQVKRNIERFPEDFMFQLTKDELEHWRSHFATSNPGAKMGLRRLPYCFTEHGALMAANEVYRFSMAVHSIESSRVKDKNGKTKNEASGGNEFSVYLIPSILLLLGPPEGSFFIIR